MSGISKQDVLKHASNDEERLFLAKVYDNYCFYEKSGFTKYTSFLSPLEKTLAERAFKGKDIYFYGGYEGAERTVMGFSCDGFAEAVSLIESKGDFSLLSHRDFLGSLMGLGITRENIGDIVKKDDVCYIYVLSKMADYISENLISVGKVYVDNKILATDEILMEREFEETKKSVASPRADAVVATVFNLSRTDSQEAIKRGLVTLNYRILDSQDKKINEGDVISLKGKGKAEISEFLDLSKKGRQFILIKKYK